MRVGSQIWTSWTRGVREVFRPRKSTPESCLRAGEDGRVEERIVEGIKEGSRVDSDSVPTSITKEIPEWQKEGGEEVSADRVLVV